MNITNGGSQKVDCFKKLSQVTKCVIGSGFCAGHNVKLERSVKIKKISIIDNDGKVKWLMREVTSLTCPPTKPKRFGDVPAVLQSVCGNQWGEGKIVSEC